MCIRDRPVYATPSQQADDPVEQCAKGFEFFLEDKYAEALPCLLYTSDAADERSSVDLGGRRIIKKKKKIATDYSSEIWQSQYDTTTSQQSH